jgi:hypothetical protein
MFIKRKGKSDGIQFDKTYTLKFYAMTNNRFISVHIFLAGSYTRFARVPRRYTAERSRRLQIRGRKRA